MEANVPIIGTLITVILALVGIIAKIKVSKTNGDHALIYEELKRLRQETASIRHDIAKVQADRERSMVQLNLRMGEMMGKLSMLEKA